MMANVERKAMLGSLKAKVDEIKDEQYGRVEFYKGIMKDK